LSWVQFVDADCEVNAAWWQAAAAILASQPQAAVVYGRVREVRQESSVFAKLLDVEWNAPIGEALECGGTFLARAEALREVGGFNPHFIAGEEPELCVRLRQKGWRVLRVDLEMGWHEAGMRRFSQWWRREMCSGYAAAEGAATHGWSPEHHRVRAALRNWAWGLALPLLVLGATLWFGPRGLFLLVPYALLPFRIYRTLRRRYMPVSEARVYAVFCTLAKFPQMVGQLRYWFARLAARPITPIEYNGRPAA
jgi:hypothetical protein